jgi:NAD(P)-dependent dehydrogenase (short-subunit alcohol dehydrogenase family)
MIATGFVEAGAKVYIAARKHAASLETAAELSKIGECVAFEADLSSEAGCRGLADEIASREDTLDILVNNAGATWAVPIEDFGDAAWERALSVNVRGVFHMTRFLLPQLKAAAKPEDPARVINIGSIDGLRAPRMDTYSYSASKAAVHMLTRHLAGKLAPSITVNAIAPGPFESKMMAQTLADFGTEIAASAPLKRIGRPDDMAGTAIFLASRAGSYLTGVVIPVDGGLSTL